jgi:serine/threonine protein kinase
MPVPATREEFLDLVRKSGVLDEERISTFARAMAEEGVDLDQPRVLAQRMVRDGLLTTWQAKQILQGKFRRFLLSDKYKVLDPIGAGGMGSVYLCFHIYMHRFVALKFLPVDKLKDKSMKERFYREARAAAALDHPNIVRAYDIDWEASDGEGQSELHYLIMEFVDGASLQEIVSRSGPLSPERAAHYIKQAAQGLEHAHEAGLVHRDIKPGNLLVDRSGTVKVLDLGLARFFQPGKDNVTERFDENNAILGTADYLAPEQARGDSVDIRADIYSLGSTLYFLLSGKAPFEEGSITQKLLWAQTKPPKPIRDVRPEVPEEMAAVLERMMAKDADDRYPTPAAVIEALAPWTATPIPPPSPEEMPRRSAAASSPATLGQNSMVPSTPSPRTVPSDLIRSRPGSGPIAAAAPPAPKTPPPKPGPRTPIPAAGPKSRPPGSGIRPAPKSAVRRRVRRQSRGISPGVIFGAAAAGAGLLIVGLIIAWLWRGRTHSTETASTAPAATQAKSKGSGQTNRPIKPEQAATHYGEHVTVEFTVMSVGPARPSDVYYLNSKVNYQDAKNFTVRMDKRILDQFASKGILTADGFRTKKIRVTGTVTKYNERAQITVESADQIHIQNR